MLGWTATGLCALVPMATCAPDNLLDNPSLEEVQDGNIIGWETQPPGSAEARDDGGHEGQGYARFVDTGDKSNIVLESKRLPARPGGMYRASAWFRTLDDCDPGVYLNFYDDLGTRVHHRYERAEGPTDGWVRVEVTTAAPPDSLEVSTTLYAYMGDVGTFDADDVSMTVEGGARHRTDPAGRTRRQADGRDRDAP